jgi:hypothetical protein
MLPGVTVADMVSAAVLYGIQISGNWETSRPFHLCLDTYFGERIFYLKTPPVFIK